ncbi:hypothetical protein KABACHOK_02500 [Brevundimonas phage vB_BpoS-Kabachok]|uniref:C2H2-type domain-containing protein n=1 Tax=Brevundimonas phage vB_BpoS-Kabachok TaxID=2948600 RepID=A0A9E7MNS9_9CAUD|nr:hypothetical protein KABACHOK_02500 [Brevundimonas phage vB_BpoS-Kabachok]
MGGASYKCPDCDEWFLGKSHLRAHLKAAHPRPPEVLNARDFDRHNWPPGTTAIMRGTPFGNPFIRGRDGDRDTVIDKFIAAKSQDPEFIALVKKRLKGRHLMCACAPLRCHGDWLCEIANAD